MLKNIELIISPATIDYLTKNGFSPEYGARPLKRLIQNKILNPVAEFIIGRKLDTGGTVEVTIKNGLPFIELKKSNRRSTKSHREKILQTEKSLLSTK